MKLYYIIIFTTFLSTFTGIIYIKNTLKWQTKPNRITWGIWATAPLIASIAMYFSQGFNWNILPVFMAWFMPLLIFLSSFVNKKSYWKLHTFDYICLFSAILALVLWWITNNPLLAIIFSILADFFAALPLIIKIYKIPETETVSPFIAWLFANLSAFLVITEWKIEEYLFSLYLVIICSVLILAYFWKRILNKINFHLKS